MREGEIRCCSECGQPIPRERGKLAFTCSPRCRRIRDARLHSERMGIAPGQGSPSPRSGAAPPIRRPPRPSDPPTPADPLPINDPTSGELRRRLLAEAEALLALPHVEAVTINVRAGTVVSLRSMREPVELTGSWQPTPQADNTPPSLREFLAARRAHS